MCITICKVVDSVKPELSLSGKTGSKYQKNILMKNLRLLILALVIGSLYSKLSAQVTTRITFDEQIIDTATQAVLWQPGDALPASIGAPYTTQGYSFTQNGYSGARIETQGLEGNRLNSGSFGRIVGM